MTIMESSRDLLSPAEQKLMELKRQQELKKQSNPDNALIVAKDRIPLLIDTSSSMAGYFKESKRHQAAKSAMQRIITASDAKSTAYSLITFNSDSYLVYKMGTPFSKFIGTSFSPTGGTTLFPAIQLALHENPTRCIILSDGEVYDLTYDVIPFIKEHFIPKGIKIDVIAICEANNSLAILSELTGGRFARASDEAELEKLFLDLEPRNYLRLESK